MNTSIGVSNMNNSRHNWAPPGKDCGLCGCRTCEIFLILVNTGDKKFSDCPFYYKQPETADGIEQEALFPKKDVLGKDYDFILHPLPGEISARKIVLPFRSDQVDKMKISPGDIVLGRPMGAGCPIPHVLKVIEADPVTGLLYTWVVGPKYSRGKKVKDVVAYHMIGFEGIARNIKREPQFGKRHTFLPGFCMMSINHTGLVNMVLTKKAGLHVRIENIIIIN